LRHLRESRWAGVCQTWKETPEWSNMAMEVDQWLCRDIAIDRQQWGEFMRTCHDCLDKTAFDGLCCHCFGESCSRKSLYFLTATSSPTVNVWSCHGLTEWFGSWSFIVS
jgi:hypothetical protein